jgi:ribonuclease HI
MTLIAKYPASCGVCSSGISPGDEISKVGERWAHATCLPGGAAASQPTGAASKRATAVKKPAAKKPAAKKVAVAAPTPPGALEVWTDGACSGNPGPGGWAWATRDGRQGSGGAPATTNQRMEIQAALEAVTTLPGTLVVVSDSTYVVNCFRDAWWQGWLARGWVNSAKKPVANRDLWEPLITAVRDRGDITFRWVKGHSGDEMNDLVDRLAVEAGRAVNRTAAR